MLNVSPKIPKTIIAQVAIVFRLLIAPLLFTILGRGLRMVKFLRNILLPSAADPGSAGLNSVSGLKINDGDKSI